ncbi:MAG TPA: hypothetical protein VLH40_02580 [Atribacteraceae bacterium]|nr:hypothetical protein [Atribacteraceae bacterium]
MIKTILEYALAAVACIIFITAKNNLLTWFWPLLSEMNILSAFVLFVLAREKLWILAVAVVLTAGFLLDVLSFSPFGVNLLFASFLSVLGFIWIHLFEKDALVLGGFFLAVPLFDWFFIHFISVLTGSVRRVSLEYVLVLLLSIPINILLFMFYRFILPEREADYVE